MIIAQAPSPIDPTTWNLTSITGVVIVTGVLVELLKRLFTRYQGLGKIPTFVYAMCISAVLTILAHYVFKPNGKPALEGDIWQLLWKAVIAAGTTSGLYTWLVAPTSIAHSSPLPDALKQSKLERAVRVAISHKEEADANDTLADKAKQDFGETPETRTDGTNNP